MKKWQKRLISVVAVLVVLCAAGVLTFKLYIEPKYVDKVITVAQNVVRNEALNNSVSELVQQMDEEGTLDEKTLEMYNQAFGTEDTDKIESIIDSDDISAEDIMQEAERASEESDSQSEETSEDKDNSSDSKSDSTSKSDTNNSGSEKESGSSDTSKATPTPTEKSSSKQSSSSGTTSATGSTAQERIKAAATAEEYAAGAKILAKIDLSKAKSLYQSDKSAFMEYLNQTLSKSEINQALQLYFKYKDLL